jgi:excisionase family DNA binding protein
VTANAEAPTPPRTVTIDEAGRMLGISRGLAYDAAKRGEIPTVKIGRRLLVPRARLLELIGDTAEVQP